MSSKQILLSEKQNRYPLSQSSVLALYGKWGMMGQTLSIDSLIVTLIEIHVPSCNHSSRVTLDNDMMVHALLPIALARWNITRTFFAASFFVLLP